MPELNPIRVLSDLLRAGGAQPVLSPDRVVSSSIYDLHYRLSVIACAFETHAKTDLANVRRIKSATLKLLQFVAIRPWLLPVMRDWQASQADPQLSALTLQRLRRGYLGDAMHDRVIGYLVAGGIFEQTAGHLRSGKNISLLAQISSAIKAEKLFVNELRTLEQMSAIRITNAMLEGE